MHGHTNVKFISDIP